MFCSVFYLVNCCRCRFLFDILYGSTFGAVDFSSIFYLVLQWALPSFARNTTYYNNGGCRVLFDILLGKTVAPVEYCETFSWYNFGRCQVLLDILFDTAVVAVKFCLTLYMVQQSSL